MKLRFFVDRMHDPLTLETWQFRSVAEGRVSRDALLLYLAVQAVGREGREADMDAIGRALQLDPKACLDALLAAGWILESKGGWRMPAPRVAGAVTLSKDEPPKASPSPVAASGLAAVTTRPKRKRTPKAAPTDATSATPAVPTDPLAAPSPPAQAVPEPPPAPELVAFQAWIEAVARRLIEVYPHGVMEGGHRRPAPPREVAKKLRVIMQPLEPAERDALAAEIVRVAELYARCVPDLEQRKFVPGLVVWLNQRRWEDPPVLAKGGNATVARNEQAQRQHAERRNEGYAPKQAVDPAALEEARRRREQAVRDAHRVDAARTEAGHA